MNVQKIVISLQSNFFTTFLLQALLLFFFNGCEYLERKTFAVSKKKVFQFNQLTIIPI